VESPGDFVARPTRGGAIQVRRHQRPLRHPIVQSENPLSPCAGNCPSPASAHGDGLSLYAASLPITRRAHAKRKLQPCVNTSQHYWRDTATAALRNRSLIDRLDGGTRLAAAALQPYTHPPPVLVAPVVHHARPSRRGTYSATCNVLGLRLFATCRLCGN